MPAFRHPPPNPQVDIVRAISLPPARPLIPLPWTYRVKEEDSKRQGHEQVHGVRLAPSAPHAAAAAIKKGVHSYHRSSGGLAPRGCLAKKCPTALAGGVLQAPPSGTKHVLKAPVGIWGRWMGGWMETRGHTVGRSSQTLGG